MTDNPCASLTSDGNVSIVTLHRPERLNAIGGTLLADLHRMLIAAHSDPETGAIVLTGAGPAFCAGDDLKEFGQQAATPESVVQTCEAIQQITRDIMFGPKLVVGAVHGYAVGGGFEWLLNCDLVVAADDLIAFFPEMELGHFVTGGVTHLLPQTVGYQRAMELLVLGERQNAQALHQLGLVNRVVPKDELMPTAIALARKIATRSSQSTATLKKVLTSGIGPQLSGALEQERQAAMACFASAETARRVSAHSIRR